MKKFKVGDRVKTPLMGEGTVRDNSDSHYYLVEFDNYEETMYGKGHWWHMREEELELVESEWGEHLASMSVVEPEEVLEDESGEPLSGGPSILTGKVTRTLTIECEPFDEVFINGYRYVLDE